jgi:WD40 repeat protein
LQLIGEGGMGSVWMAEQTEPMHRLVAVKVVKAGLDSAQVGARFEAERQALALMDHPNIAKVLDAGTTEDDRPFFVMELVKGTPITRYCDEHRLTPRQRLELFVPVCQALQHAHQKGIIHRDIKPSNVLVAPYDGKPVVKVIDFGVAKATGPRLTERTLFTEFGAVIGTLEYMSPEQAELNNQDIDTRSDIYSLGVLLYEMLTGSTPLDRTRLAKAALSELLRCIREEEPPRPSARLSASKETLPTISAQRQMEPAKLSKLMRGELDWIVMKALEKDRGRRYETANGLARDIERYLHEEPVEACPPSAGYRLRKFLRRNKGPVTAATLVLLALLGGIAGTTWGLWEEAEQRALAERERDEKEQARTDADQQRREATAARDHAETALYFNRINLAHQYWKGLNLWQSRHILDSCPSDSRGWEWRYLDRLHHAELLNLTTANTWGSQLLFSHDGKRLVVARGKFGGEIRVWDMAAPKLLAEFSPARDLKRGFDCAALSADGRTLALGDFSGKVSLWNPDNGQLSREFAQLPRPIRRMSFSPDGRWLAAALGGIPSPKASLIAKAPPNEDLVVWELASGKEIFHPQGYGVVAQFSPDGSRLVTFKRDLTLALTPMAMFRVALFDTARWTEVAVGQLGAIDISQVGEIHNLTTEVAAFSRDGKRLALQCWDGQRHARVVQVLDPASGKELLNVVPRMVGIMDLSPDGTTLAVCDRLASAHIDLWDLKQQRRVRTLRGHQRQVSTLAFAPDGRLASSAADGIKFWDPATDPEVRHHTGRSFVLAVPNKISAFENYVLATPAVLSPDGTRLAYGRATTSVPSGLFFSMTPVRTIILVDAETGQVTRTLPGHPDVPLALAFSQDGQRLASASLAGDAKVWESATGKELCSYRDQQGPIAALALSADGRWAASAQAQKELARYSYVRPLDARVEAIKADGTKLLPISVKVWDATSGQQRWELQGHRGGVYHLAFSPDGRRLASAGYQALKIWDLASGRLERELSLDEPRTDFDYGLVFSPAGDLLATLGRSGVQLWDVTSGRSVALFQGVGGIVAFSPDQARLATASGREVKLWDTRSRQEALTLPLPEPAVDAPPNAAALAWSADGHWLRAGLSDGAVVEWDATPTTVPAAR